MEAEFQITIKLEDKELCEGCPLFCLEGAFNKFRCRRGYIILDTYDGDPERPDSCKADDV